MPDLARCLDNRSARLALARHDIASVYRILRAAGVSPDAYRPGHRAAAVGGVGGPAWAQGDIGRPAGANRGRRSEGRHELEFGEPNEALKILQLAAGGAPTELSRTVLECSCALALARVGLGREAETMLCRARDVRQHVTDTSGLWRLIAETMPHVEGCTQLELGRFDLAVAALTSATGGADHAVRCSTLNLGELATAQLRSGELQAGLATSARVLDQAGRRARCGYGNDSPRCSRPPPRAATPRAGIWHTNSPRYATQPDRVLLARSVPLMARLRVGRSYPPYS